MIGCVSLFLYICGKLSLKSPFAVQAIAKHHHLEILAGRMLPSLLQIESH